jgi:hypothetical protein
LTAESRTSDELVDLLRRRLRDADALSHEGGQIVRVAVSQLQ